MGILDSFKNLARPYDENDMFLDDEEILEEEFPEPEKFMALMQSVGFEKCTRRSQSFGIAQIYIGQKP